MTEAGRVPRSPPGGPDPIADRLLVQSGVISRAQVHLAGEAVWDIRRRLRRREWVRVLPGVYLDHTGVPTWVQRGWAGVLYLWPAALAGESARARRVGAGLAEVRR
jgi:hypothetical protein